MAETILKRSKNGCEVTIHVSQDKKLWIQATGKTTNMLADAIKKLNYSTFDPTWVMNQLMKTL